MDKDNPDPDKGKVVTDRDNRRRSNIPRRFLFRTDDYEQFTRRSFTTERNATFGANDSISLKMEKWKNGKMEKWKTLEIISCLDWRFLRLHP